MLLFLFLTHLSKVIKVAKPIAVICNTFSVIIGIVLCALGKWIINSITTLVDNISKSVESIGEKHSELLEEDWKDELEKGTEAFNDAIDIFMVLVIVGVIVILKNILGCLVILGHKPKGINNTRSEESTKAI